MKTFNIELTEKNAQQLILYEHNNLNFACLNISTEFCSLISEYYRISKAEDNEEIKSFINDDPLLKISKAEVLLTLTLRRCFPFNSHSYHSKANSKSLIKMTTLFDQENILYEVLDLISNYNSSKSTSEASKLVMADILNDNIFLSKEMLELFLRGWFSVDFKIKIMKHLIVKQDFKKLQVFSKSKSSEIKCLFLQHEALDKLPFYLNISDKKAKAIIEKRLTAGK